MRFTKILLLMTLIPFFSVGGFGQSGQPLVELKGFEFYNEGKLKNLKIGVSTQKDVVKIFGEQCKVTCDYNENWIIEFEYWEELSSIILRPKNRTSFSTILFPSNFEKGVDYLKTYEDKSTGLIYKLFDRDFRLPGKSLPKSDIWEKGDLISVEYTYPAAVREKMRMDRMERRQGTPFYRIPL